MQDKPLVGIVMGSDSDFSVMEETLNILDSFSVPYEVIVSSAHRSPERTSEFTRNAQNKGIEVIIAGAGWAAHLAGVIASETTLPVIGVPINSSPLNGMDALLATVQMPTGIPVATMAIGKGGAGNAGVFAVQILALNHPELKDKLARYKEQLKKKVEEKSATLLNKIKNR
jgi:phosphoribosylaminoimidazole carboxylase PurE protein